MLPDVVQSRGLTVSKSTRNYLMLVGLTSDLPGTKVEDLGDYAVSTVETVLARVPGVGEVEIMGSGYAMRIWLDPDRLTKYRHDGERCHRPPSAPTTRRCRRASWAGPRRCRDSA